MTRVSQSRPMRMILGDDMGHDESKGIEKEQENVRRRRRRRREKRESQFGTVR